MREHGQQSSGGEGLLQEIVRVHEQYRKAGLALMTTVITLAVGVLYHQADKPGSRCIDLAFFGSIVFALVQECLNYLGGRYEAQAFFHFWKFHFLDNREGNEQAVATSCQKKANRLLGWADWLCPIAVGVFVVAGFLYVLFQ